MADLSIIDARPVLRQWILSGKWRNAFDSASLSRGRAYASDRFIRELAIGVGPAGDLPVCSASVIGTAPNPYGTEVIFRQVNGVWSVDPDCSCPVGSFCKHAAALVFYLSDMLSRSNQPALIPPELREWLDRVEAAATAGAPPADTAEKPENRFLAYCIEQPPHRDDGVYHLVLRVATVGKSGALSLSSGRASADLSRQPKYMTPRDVVACAAYHNRFRKERSWGDMPFTGDGWEELLAAAFETGHVFLGRGSSGHRAGGDYLPVVQAPPRPVRATWKITPSGSARPVLECDDADLVILQTVPPRFLDPATGELGLLENDLPPAVLGAWQAGPAISSVHLPAVCARFNAVTAAPLPVPAKVESTTRPPAAPVPRLRIHTRRFSNRFDEMVHLVGELTYRYDDSPWLVPLSRSHPPSHSEFRGGKRIIWPRDFDAELALREKLGDAGLISLVSLMPVASLDTAGLHSFVPRFPLPSEQLAWLALLESPAFQAMRDAGWVIETDPKSGLTSIGAGDFFPVIDPDPDHGIDWFRFDITCDLDGKEIGIIPVIARAIAMDLPPADAPDLPEFLVIPRENPEDGVIRFPARRLLEMLDQVRHLFHATPASGPIRLDRLTAAGVADTLEIDSSATTRALAKLGRSLKNITELPAVALPSSVRAELRHYQLDGFRWLQFLAGHGLNGILADDMGLGKTVQALSHLAAEHGKNPGLPSLVVAPTSVVPNWAAEAEKFVPHLKVLMLQGKDRATGFGHIAGADLVITSYPLLARDFESLAGQKWHAVVLDEAQYIKNPKSVSAQNACRLESAHRICLSGTPMENHLGELWSLMRFLMPGFLSDEKTFNSRIRRPIERDRSRDAQLVLNRRVSPLILRRTKDQVASELPEKTEIIHGIDLTKKQTDLYESVRAAMDKRVRDAIAAKGLAKSHIIVLDALLKLRQICCHPQLLKSAGARGTDESAKLEYLTDELLPTLVEEGRRILLFSTFTSMLAIIERHLEKEKIPYLILTGKTVDRAPLVERFQQGDIPVFLISLKAGGTGLNLTAADTVIHYDPWWNPAAENQATDRAHRIGQTKPVFVHKLVCRGTIEDRILELQKHKAGLVEALLSDETSKLKIDAETLTHLLAPLE